MAGHTIANAIQGHLTKQERPRYLQPVDRYGQCPWSTGNNTTTSSGTSTSSSISTSRSSNNNSNQSAGASDSDSAPKETSLDLPMRVLIRRPINPFFKGTATVALLGGEAALTPFRLHGIVHGFAKKDRLISLHTISHGHQWTNAVSEGTSP
ncbi:unnamed protein product [Mortierella alpina]